MLLGAYQNPSDEWHRTNGRDERALDDVDALADRCPVSTSAQDRVWHQLRIGVDIEAMTGFGIGSELDLASARAGV